MRVLKKLVVAMSLLVGGADLSVGLAEDALRPMQTERIMGFEYNAEGITYQVYSGGCTQKSDFELLSQETWPVGLRLVRKQPDLCEASIPYGVKIFFNWEEIGFREGTQFHIVNSLRTGRIE